MKHESLLPKTAVINASFSMKTNKFHAKNFYLRHAFNTPSLIMLIHFNLFQYLNKREQQSSKLNF
jgi:hypothetical protein